jgi:transcriptional regulator with XRE-family HTH domain
MIDQLIPYTEVMAGRPPSKPAPTFGAQLSALRKARGFTQPQLAKMLDISVDMLTYYERRAKNPTAEFVAKVAKALNISADELLGHSVKNGRKSGPPSLIEQRLQAIRQLPRERQKLLLQVLDTFLRDANQHAKAA